MLRKNLLLLSVFIFCIPANVSAQLPQIASVVHNIHKLDSKFLGEQRTILVRVPQNYANGNEKFPMFISIGDEPDYVKGFNSFQDLLKRAKPKNLEYEFRQFKEENHSSGVLPTYYWGLRKVFDGFRLSDRTINGAAKCREARKAC